MALEDWRDAAARLVDAAHRLDRDHAVREIRRELHIAHQRGILAGIERADRIVKNVFADLREPKQEEGSGD